MLKLLLNYQKALQTATKRNKWTKERRQKQSWRVRVDTSVTLTRLELFSLRKRHWPKEPKLADATSGLEKQVKRLLLFASFHVFSGLFGTCHYISDTNHLSTFEFQYTRACCNSPQSVTQVIPASLFPARCPGCLQGAVPLPLSADAACVSGRWALTRRRRLAVQRHHARSSPHSQSSPSPASRGPGSTRVAHSDKIRRFKKLPKVLFCLFRKEAACLSQLP